MSKPKIYIDGQEGTTGLQIYDRLEGRDDISLLRIDPEKRKDLNERKKLLNEADLVFLCLPQPTGPIPIGSTVFPSCRRSSGKLSEGRNGWPIRGVTPRASFRWSIRW